MTSSGVLTATPMTGITLLLGSLMMLSGAAVFAFVRDAKGRIIFGQPPREWLRLVYTHAGLWRSGTALFMAGTLVTLFGWGLLAGHLQGAGEPGFTRFGLLALAIGATLWLIILAFRVSAEMWAARTAAETDSVPETYAPLTAWLGVLFVLYTILTYGGLALFGGAMLTTHLLPQWLGWVCIIYGLAGFVMLAVLRDAPPFTHYLPTLLIGVMLVLP